jgi:hypothetical protein
MLRRCDFRPMRHPHRPLQGARHDNQDRPAVDVVRPHCLFLPAVPVVGDVAPPGENTKKAHASGSLAFSRDGALLSAVDTDLGLVGVIDVASQKLTHTVKVGDAQYRVAVGADDTVFVANRKSRSVSVIRRGEGKVSAELPTDIDPVALGVAGDGTLYVVCATASDAAEYGSVKTLQERVLKNPGDQHGVTSTLTDAERTDLVAYLRTL